MPDRICATQPDEGLRRAHAASSATRARVRAALGVMATMCRQHPGDPLDDAGRLSLANAASLAGTTGVAEILSAAPRIWETTTRGEYALVLDKAAYALTDGAAQ
ncbi:hypothetical protein OG897_06280 [Streptomyces sp. NBC_00237]|uniref:hypothetical protein n=1 Tax=Streptomyces sp. NBC_00237 TaxID=2975687 RepID=UPI00224D8DEC|nr:hypothetical protein [Streptomyces sp. NBC_00237]MCX5201069.1 hypothetical protein [Streptomyces sp. NBC_00237]